MTTVTLETQKSRHLSFELHRILVKGYENTEITTQLVDDLYNNLSVRYKDSLVSFSFIDGDYSFEIKLSNHFDDVEQYIRQVYYNFINQMLINQYSILVNYDYNNILQEIISSINIEYIINNCITILNLSTDPNSMIIKINLHN